TFDDVFTTASRTYFKESINNAWIKLNEYYIKFNENPVYAAFMLVNPKFKWRYIDEKWITARQKAWIDTTKSNVREFYDKYYKINVSNIIISTIITPNSLFISLSTISFIIFSTIFRLRLG